MTKIRAFLAAFLIAVGVAGVGRVAQAEAPERLRPAAACSAWVSSPRIGIGYCAASSGIKSYRLNGSCRNASGKTTFVKSGTAYYGGVLSVVCPQGTKLTSVWFSNITF